MGLLLSHQARRHRVVLVLVPLGLALFHFLVTRIAPSPEETQRFGAMLSFLPPALLDAVGFQNAMSVTARGLLSFGYVHPFTILLLSLWTVRVTCSGLAGEIGEGTMDLLAARPVGRMTQVLAVAAMTALGIVLAVTAAWSGTAVGLATRDLGDARPGMFVRTALGLALLFAAWAGFALAVAASHRRGGGAMAVVTGVMAAMFALDYIGRLYAPLRLARWASPFAYFVPQQQRDLMLDPAGTAMLGSVAVAGLLVALVVFRLRDL
jgi:hypothetical protein